MDICQIKQGVDNELTSERIQTVTSDIILNEGLVKAKKQILKPYASLANR